MLIDITRIQKYPNSRIVGISNSSTQREHILGVAKEKGFENVEVSVYLPIMNSF